MRFKKKYFFPLALLSGFVSMVTAVWLVVFWQTMSPAEEALFKHLFVNRFAHVLAIGFLGLCGLAFALGALLHYYLIPLRKLTEETQLITTVNPSHRIELKGAKDIQRLVDAINRGADRFEEAQGKIRSIIQRGKRQIEEEKNILAAILSQLTDGVLLCNNSGRIMFYNQRARELLSTEHGNDPGPVCTVGLGRSIFALLNSDQLTSAIEGLDEDPSLDRANPSRSFFTGGSSGRRLNVKAALALNSQQEKIGYVLIVSDVSVESYTEEILGRGRAGRLPDISDPSRLDLPIAVPLTGMRQLPGKPGLAGSRCTGLYDFDLLARIEGHGRNGDRSLAELSYTVFDTETTGLYPWDGDEIISIGAARIVNARLLQNEVFHQFIDPQRIIRVESMKVHGIRPEMLKGCPTIGQVLPQFHRFVENSILVGHNIGFDMRFLQMKEEATGVIFDNPVLDTMLLSVVVHPNQEEHSLEAIASRLGVELAERHNALGDALSTGRILLGLIRLLNEKGIRTLAQAVEASRETYYSRIRY